MKVRQAGIERRTVVQAYAAYDCSKKLRPAPDFAAWDWSNADAIDQQMLSVELKSGILGGYHLWDMVEICLSDLGECAVLADIFPGPTRALGLLERAGRLASWMPPHRTGWYDDIVGGHGALVAFLLPWSFLFPPLPVVLPTGLSLDQKPSINLCPRRQTIAPYQVCMTPSKKALEPSAHLRSRAPWLSAGRWADLESTKLAEPVWVQWNGRDEAEGVH